MKVIIVAITGASGTVLGVRLLELLRDMPDVKTHLILSDAAKITLSKETDISISDVCALADHVHNSRNIGAAISSGSFPVNGMVIVPCSMNTAAKIAHGIADNLISRAADVMLKERRTLVLAVRETPLHLGHLETLTTLARIGAVVFPPVPSFYSNPKTVDDIVNQSCMRILDQIGIESDVAPRWNGVSRLVKVN